MNTQCTSILCIIVHMQNRYESVPKLSGEEHIPILSGYFLTIHKVENGCVVFSISSKNGISINLEEFSEGLKCKYGLESGYSYEDDVVYINPRSIHQDPRSILEILHEIGHRNIHRQRGILKYFYGKMLGVSYRRMRESKTESMHTLREEKAAWIEAIRILRALRDRGIPLHTLWRDGAALKLWIHEHALNTYILNWK